MLPACDQEPQNEIRVEVAGLEEAYTTACRLSSVANRILKPRYRGGTNQLNSPA
jgi:hypothetical protein